MPMVRMVGIDFDFSKSKWDVFSPLKLQRTQCHNQSPTTSQQSVKFVPRLKVSKQVEIKEILQRFVYVEITSRLLSLRSQVITATRRNLRGSKLRCKKHQSSTTHNILISYSNCNQLFTNIGNQIYYSNHIVYMAGVLRIL